MDWYYYTGQEQKGPVSDDEFNSLVKSGVITAGTLVWHSGLSGWEEYGTLAASAPAAAQASAPAAGQVVCSECGRAFAEDDVIRHGNSIICENCKPMFLQKLKEGSWTDGAYNYAGFWIRFAAKILDGIIIWILQMLVMVPFGLLMSTAGENPNLIIAATVVMQILSLGVALGYYAFFLGKYAATPGKMACGLKVIVADGSRVSYLRAVGRFFSEWLSGLILLIGYIMAGFDKEKRALHDRICSTRVIKK